LRFEEKDLNERRSKQTGCEEILEFVAERPLKMNTVTWKCRLNCRNKEWKQNCNWRRPWSV